MHRTKNSIYYVLTGEKTPYSNSAEEAEHVSSDEEVEEGGMLSKDPFRRVKWYFPDLSDQDADAILRVHQLEGSFLLRSFVKKAYSREGEFVQMREYSVKAWFGRRSWQFKVELGSEGEYVTFGLKKYSNIKEFDKKMREGYLLSTATQKISLKIPIPNISEPSITKEKHFEQRIARISTNEDPIYPGNKEQTQQADLEKWTYEAHNGYLIKQGHFVKNWKKRWFSLEKNSLSYYKSNARSEDPIKSINLGAIERIIEKDHSYKQSYCFTIITKTGYKLVMQAENETEHKRWVEKLGKVIRSNKRSFSS